MINRSLISLRNIILVLVSLTISVLLCNYKGEVWEEKARTFLYKLKKDSVPNFAKETVDNKGIPYVFYSEQNGIAAGKQYNPTIISNYAIDYYRQLQTVKNSSVENSFKNCVDWLVNNMTNKGSYSLYLFNWQQPWYPSVGVPYTSGMTSARAIEALTYAAAYFKSPQYLTHARQLLNGFFIPIEAGGFTYKTTNGWWYEELADTGMQTPKILDGHIFAVTGVYRYWLETKDDSAKHIVQKGLQALKENLQAYDAGKDWSYYDIYKKPSDKKYHRILTAQMKELYELSNDPLFLNYYKKWNAYFEKPYLVRAIQEGNRTSLFLLAACFVITTTLLFFLNWLYLRWKR